MVFNLMHTVKGIVKWPPHKQRLCKDEQLLDESKTLVSVASPVTALPQAPTTVGLAFQADEAFEALPIKPFSSLPELPVVLKAQDSESSANEQALQREGMRPTTLTQCTIPPSSVLFTPTPQKRFGCKKNVLCFNHLKHYLKYISTLRKQVDLFHFYIYPKALSPIVLILVSIIKLNEPQLIHIYSNFLIG